MKRLLIYGLCITSLGILAITLFLMMLRRNPVSSAYGLAFVSNHNGWLNIFLIPPGGGESTPLRATRSNDIDPAWNPDGRWLAFVSSERGRNLELYRMRRNGTGLQRLTFTNQNNRAPAWSPDGRHIAFLAYSARASDLYVIALDESEPRRITDFYSQKSPPLWSPDGEWLLFSDNRSGQYEIYRIRPDGSDLQQLSFGASDKTLPRWSPDGTSIAFRQLFGTDDNHIYRDGQAHIVVLNLESGNMQVLLDTEGDDGLPYWSPDGEFLIAETHYFEKSCMDECQFVVEINRVNIASRSFEPIIRTRTFFADASAVPSPDNRSISLAVYNNITNVPDIFRVDVSTGTRSPLSTLSGNKNSPVWSPLVDLKWRPYALLSAALLVLLAAVMRLMYIRSA